MKKFKVKNRVKRKYTRRTTVSTPSNFTRTFNAGLLPSFVLLILLLSNLFIALPRGFTIQPPQITFTPPTFSFEGISTFILSLPQTMQQITTYLGTFVAWMTLQFAQLISWWSTTTIQTSESLSVTSAQLIQTFTNNSATFGSSVLTFFSSVGALTWSLILWFTNQLLTLIQTVRGIRNMLVQSSVMLLYQGGQMSFMFLQQLFFMFYTGTIELLTSIGQTILLIVTAIGSLFYSSFVAIGTFLTHSLTAIVNWFITVGTGIQQPFIVLGEQLEKTKPWFEYLGASFSHSAESLSHGVNNLGGIPSHSAK
ncbi:MAG: hypothetical protein AAB553_00035 [Patescibacteria group bacterium]